MDNPKKIFAFKLAEKKDKAATSKWKAREGVSLAGCSEVRFGNFRTSSFSGDNGIFC